ncbi:MAG: hypothetical protein Hens3KO_01250 [Henriciella sp.]
MKTLLTAIAITVAAISVPLSSSAQLSQKEIDDAVTAMRNAGIDEAKIEKFQSDIADANAKMEAFNANPPPEPPDLKSGDELLAEQRAEFQQAYGTAPEANIAFRGETHVLKVTSCTQGEGWFIIEAKSQPGPNNAIFGALRNTGQGGVSYTNIDFETGNMRAGVTVDPMNFDGSAFAFEGVVYATDAEGKTPEPINVSLSCPG